MTTESSLFKNYATIQGGHTIRAGGIASGGGVFVRFGDVYVDSDFILQNSSFSVNAGSTVHSGYMCSFDSTSADCITVLEFGQWCSSTTYESGNLLYGSLNTGHAVRVKTGGGFAYSTKPTINVGLGAGRECLVGAVDRLWSAIPYADSGAAASQAYVVALV